MLSFLADENFSGPIVSGLHLRLPTLDIVRVQDVGLSSADDPALLEWAAQNKRVLLTHDVQTVTRYAYERVKAGLPMSGVLEVKYSLQFGPVIDELVLIAECTELDEWQDQVKFLHI